MRYLHERRKALGGYLPARIVTAPALKPHLEPIFEEFYEGTGDRKVVDDDGVRADAGEAAARQGHRQARRADRARRGADLRHGIAVPRRSASTRTSGQLYEPVDKDTLLYYKEAKDGQILEEGITEAGSMSSFIAAGTAYATHGVNTIPFFIYYSMFGFQRIGDLIWAAGDHAPAASCSAAPPAGRRSTARACSTRTATATLLASPVPNCLVLRPGVRLRDGRDHPGRHPTDVRRAAKASSTT